MICSFDTEPMDLVAESDFERMWLCPLCAGREIREICAHCTGTPPCWVCEAAA